MKIKDKVELSGLLLLIIGVVLLAFTFINAYLLLVQDIGIVATSDLAAVFGEALAPLIATCIRVMYLGIMGWIGSMLTIRGIPLLTHPKPTVQKIVKVKPKIKQAKPARQVVKTAEPVKKEVPKPEEKEEKPPEEFVVIPESIPQTVPESTSQPVPQQTPQSSPEQPQEQPSQQQE